MKLIFSLQKFQEIAKLFPRMVLHVMKPKLEGACFACQMQYVIDPNHITCFLTAISCIHHARKVTDKFQGVARFAFCFNNYIKGNIISFKSMVDHQVIENISSKNAILMKII